MQPNSLLTQNKKEYRLFVANKYPELIKLKQNGYRESFNQVLLKITLKLRAYIKNYINLAWRKGYFAKDDYIVKDVISSLFLEIYDCIEDVQSEKDLYVWLYQTTHILLENISVNEGFNDSFYQNIENFSNEEWDNMAQKYASDGDMLIVEDQEERHANHYNYILDSVFVETKTKVPKEILSETLKEQPIKNHIAMVLHHLPMPMRDVFELYTNEYLALNEIAKINNTSTEQVNALLNDASKALKMSVYKRYFN